HRAAREALDDRRDRFDLLDRDRRAGVGAQVEQTAQRRDAPRLVVDELRVLLEDVVATRARRVLELEDRLRVEEVVLALAAPLVFTSDRQLSVRELARPVGV